MSVSLIIEEINESIAIPGCLGQGKIYCLANSIVRRTGSQYDLLPGIIAKDGEITYVGLDDVESIIIYHKLLSITCQTKPGRGMADDLVNIYRCCMIVYMSREKMDMIPDEVFLLIQASTPDMIRLEPYRTIVIKFQNVDLDDQSVFEREYKGTDFRLPANHNIFQINYNIESTFSRICFNKCPGDELETMTQPPVIIPPTVLTLTYGYSATDPFVNNTTIPTIENAVTVTIIHNADISIIFPVGAVDHFLVFKELATEPVKTAWFSTVSNYGTIGDMAFRSAFVIGLYRYYVTRDAAGLAFDPSVPIQLKA